MSSILYFSIIVFTPESLAKFTVSSPSVGIPEAHPTILACLPIKSPEGT